MTFLVKDELFNCSKSQKFSKCIADAFKTLVLAHANGFDGVVNRELEEPDVENDFTHYSTENDDAEQIISDKRSLFSSKRNQNKDQIVSFFRNALARNYKLKSNIKTTRF